MCGNIAGIWSNPVNVTMKGKFVIILLMSNSNHNYSIMFYVVPEPIIIIAIEATYTSDRSLTTLMIEFRGSDRVGICMWHPNTLITQ